MDVEAEGARLEDSPATGVERKSLSFEPQCPLPDDASNRAFGNGYINSARHRQNCAYGERRMREELTCCSKDELCRLSYNERNREDERYRIPQLSIHKRGGVSNM